MGGVFLQAGFQGAPRLAGGGAVAARSIQLRLHQRLQGIEGVAGRHLRRARLARRRQRLGCIGGAHHHQGQRQVEASLPERRQLAVRAGFQQGHTALQQAAASCQIATGAQQRALDLRDATLQPQIALQMQVGIAAQAADGVGRQNQVTQHQAAARQGQPGFGPAHAHLRPGRLNLFQHLKSLAAQARRRRRARLCASQQERGLGGRPGIEGRAIAQGVESLAGRQGLGILGAVAVITGNLRVHESTHGVAAAMQTVHLLAQRLGTRLDTLVLPCADIHGQDVATDGQGMT